MAKGYWIVHVSVTDAGHYPKYLAADGPVFEAWGAKFLVRGGAFDTVEGGARERHVILEFDSYKKARDCYHSAEYQAAAKLRQAYAKSEVLIVEGVS